LTDSNIIVPPGHRTGFWRANFEALVHRFRSSHPIAARPFANFGIKGAVANFIKTTLLIPSAAFEFEVPKRVCGEG
jgi:hypothetical protein